MTRSINFTQVLPWIKEAGQLALSYYQTGLTRQHKEDNSPVTEADRVVEKFLIHKIEQTCNRQDYGIIAEESGGIGQGKEFLWAIDPIDGTRVFIDGLPLWSISVGLLHRGEAYRGAVYLPVINEIFYTDDDGIPFWNHRPLRGMLRTTWDQDSFIGVPSGAHCYFNINFRRVRALGSVATHHVYVARGAAVAALHRKVNVWDLAGAHAILSAAGGTAIYLSGQPVFLADLLTANKTQQPMLVGHPAILDKLRSRIELKQKIQPGITG